MGEFGQESETVEFKRSTAQIDRALKTVCAFLNHKGGSLYFGVSDKGRIIGQDVSDSTIKSISQKIRQKIKPEASPEINVLEIKSKKVIEVRIKEGSSKPYYLDGIAYKRTGTESPAISPDELERIILGKKRTYWDSEICDGATLDDIDEEKVNWYVNRKESARNSKKPDIPYNQFLINIGAAKNVDDKIIPTNAGILFFGKYPQKFFVQSPLRLVRFKGGNVTDLVLDKLDCSGSLWEMIEDA